MAMIRVVWICSFSNQEFRDELGMGNISLFKKIIFHICGRPLCHGHDSGLWNVNAIREMEKFKEIELHVICAIRGLNRTEIRFEKRGIKYYCFREENSNFIRNAWHQLFSIHSSLFLNNRKNFSRLIQEISPQIVHVIGAENPYYSLAALDVPSNIISIVSLQALLIRLVDTTDKQEEKLSFAYKGELEKQIICKADYIGTKVQAFREYILKEIKPDTKFLDISLAMGQNLDRNTYEKKFDFVYWSANINKAGLDAINSFIIAHKQNSNITLDIVGSYSDDFKHYLINLLRQNNAENNVTFEGLLPSHDDVIMQIKKARIALLPLKMDLVPNTIHEALANGLPVITTITDGTPKLNKKRETVLLSEQLDNNAMAFNMLRLLEDSELYDKLRNNGYDTEEEYDSNFTRIQAWVNAYQYISN